MLRFAFVALAVTAIFAVASPRAPRYVPIAHAADAPVFAPSAFAPMKYFDAKCARCHGPQGAFYGKDFGQGKTDAQLREVVHQMAVGPGQAPLNPVELEIETAYHRAMIGKQPFVVVTETTRDASGVTLRGEATPKSAVQIALGETQIDAKLEKYSWRATLPADADLRAAIVTATVGETKTELKLRDSAWSHAKPVEPQASATG